jgi:hypothetical protein
MIVTQIRGAADAGQVDLTAIPPAMKPSSAMKNHDVDRRHGRGARVDDDGDAPCSVHVVRVGGGHEIMAGTV